MIHVVFVLYTLWLFHGLLRSLCFYLGVRGGRHQLHSRDKIRLWSRDFSHGEASDCVFLPSLYIVTILSFILSVYLGVGDDNQLHERDQIRLWSRDFSHGEANGQWFLLLSFASTVLHVLTFFIVYPFFIIQVSETTTSCTKETRFASEAVTLVTGKPKDAALGVNFYMRVDKFTFAMPSYSKGVEAIVREVNNQ